jgi:hypothetical protein
MCMLSIGWGTIPQYCRTKWLGHGDTGIMDCYKNIVTKKEEIVNEGLTEEAHQVTATLEATFSTT